MPETPALQIRGLSKTFPGQRALADVDLELQPGEIRALVGQNGCGSRR
jgi:ABC-type sugar transport system ATPase subunit